MDPERWQQLKSVLSEAFEEESTAARLAFVERTCSGDQALLQEAESLLAEAEILRRSASDDLEACAEDAARRIRREVDSQIGKRIGAYVVTSKIGRGGMGTVYLAARADGYFEKEVAIKLLNSGIDTEEMVQRFHSERRLGHLSEARAAFRKTKDLVLVELQQNPRSGYIRAFAAYDKMRLGQKAAAEEEINQALHSATGNSQVIHFAVSVYEALGQRDRAIEVLSGSTAESIREIDQDRDLADLRRDPRFLQLIARTQEDGHH